MKPLNKLLLFSIILFFVLFCIRISYAIPKETGFYLGNNYYFLFNGTDIYGKNNTGNIYPINLYGFIIPSFAGDNITKLYVDTSIATNLSITNITLKDWVNAKSTNDNNSINSFIFDTNLVNNNSIIDYFSHSLYDTNESIKAWTRAKGLADNSSIKDYIKNINLNNNASLINYDFNQDLLNNASLINYIGLLNTTLSGLRASDNTSIKNYNSFTYLQNNTAINTSRLSSNDINTTRFMTMLVINNGSYICFGGC